MTILNRILDRLSTIPGSTGRFFFSISLKIDFGCDLIRWSKENQDRIDRISKKWKPKYLKVYGRPLDWKKKSYAFERAVKTRYPFMVESRVSELREQVWKWRNWNDVIKRKSQERRIEREGIVSFIGEE